MDFRRCLPCGFLDGAFEGTPIPVPGEFHHLPDGVPPAFERSDGKIGSVLARPLDECEADAQVKRSREVVGLETGDSGGFLQRKMPRTVDGDPLLQYPQPMVWTRELECRGIGRRRARAFLPIRVRRAGIGRSLVHQRSTLCDGSQLSDSDFAPSYRRRLAGAVGRQCQTECGTRCCEHRDRCADDSGANVPLPGDRMTPQRRDTRATPPPSRGWRMNPSLAPAFADVHRAILSIACPMLFCFSGASLRLANTMHRFCCVSSEYATRPLGNAGVQEEGMSGCAARWGASVRSRSIRRRRLVCHA